MDPLVILFKYLRGVIKETRHGGLKHIKWIPLGRLNLDILVESQLVDELINLNMSVELHTGFRKLTNKKSLKHIQLMYESVGVEDLNIDSISTKRVPD